MHRDFIAIKKNIFAQFYRGGLDGDWDSLYYNFLLFYIFAIYILFFSDFCFTLQTFKLKKRKEFKSIFPLQFHTSFSY